MDRDDAHNLAAAAGRYYAALRRIRLRKCDSCGSYYQTVRISHGYCSSACRSRAYRLRLLERELEARVLSISTRLGKERQPS